MVEQLYNEGFTVIHHEYFRDNGNLLKLRDEFDETILSFPEFSKHIPLSNVTKDHTYVLGGFSALGNPSSFHNPFVRKLREWCMSILIQDVFRPLIKEYYNTDAEAWRLEHIIDRMLVRPPKVFPTKESWHRDEAPLANSGDLTFGGWINLDTHDQYFSCVPRTHKNLRKQSGFGKIDKNSAKQYNKQRFKVKVPPGGILIFYEHIIHEVVGTSLNYPSIRLFLGWRLSKSNNRDAMIPGIDALLRDQAVMPLKSNQCPSMYAKLHWTNWRTKLQSWSQDMMEPVCLESRRVNSGADEGSVYRVVHEEMRSLSAYDMPMYAPYRKYEIALLKPRKSFCLKPVGKSRTRKTYRLI